MAAFSRSGIHPPIICLNQGSELLSPPEMNPGYGRQLRSDRISTRYGGIARANGDEQQRFQEQVIDFNHTVDMVFCPHPLPPHTQRTLGQPEERRWNRTLMVDVL